MKHLYPRFASFFLILFLLLTATYFVLYCDSNLYIREFTYNGAAEKSGMEFTQVLKIQDQLMLFLRGSKIDLSSIYATMNGKPVRFFNAKVIRHMEDVRFLFLTGFKLMGLSILYLIAQLVYLQKRTRQQKVEYLTAMQKSGVVILSFIVLLSVLSAIFFSKAFVLFHQLFFDNDLWLFDDRTDYIIRWLPESFFQHVATEIMVIFILLLLLSFTATKFYLRHLTEKEKKDA